MKVEYIAGLHIIVALTFCGEWVCIAHPMLQGRTNRV